ncbi:MAG: hypothetical protein PV344_07195, partial [Anaplasma sp.]|nr:hypothetical protein [Anaplasma sp.]
VYRDDTVLHSLPCRTILTFAYSSKAYKLTQKTYVPYSLSITQAATLGDFLLTTIINGSDAVAT